MKDWIMNKALGFPQCPSCKRWIQVFQTDMQMNYCPNCGENLNAEQFNAGTLGCGEVARKEDSE